MNKEHLNKITPEEKRISIAEICGWVQRIYGGWGEPNSPDDKFGAQDKVWDREDQLPDYLNNLDAITSACQDHITDKVKQAEFAENLIQIINRKLDGQHRFIGATPFHVATAEAGDLCDAFLLVMLP